MVFFHLKLNNKLKHTKKYWATINSVFSPRIC